MSKGLRMTEEQFDALLKQGNVREAGQRTPPPIALVPAQRAPIAIPKTNKAPVQRHRAGEMNPTEAAYALVLEGLLHAHEIAGYGFERIKLRLADRTFYTPDFDVQRLDGQLEFHEVKGFWRDDARIKIKVAAAQYPFRFIAVSKRKKRDGGGWNTETFG